LARQTQAGSSLADAGAPQLHASAPLQQRRWPAHRPAHVNEQALVSLKIKETVDAGVGRTRAVVIEDG